MVDPIDDIARQARQGSVSAIIQVLNDHLADSGVRTRAILAHGILQLLCEAATPAQLDQPTLVERVRNILESIQPRNIRRININSRIVREQQLLWLEEINRDPQNQLLWSEEITLKGVNSFKRFFEDWFEDRSNPAKPLPNSRDRKEKSQFWRGIVGGISLSLLLLLLGWVVSKQLGLAPERWVQSAIPPKPSIIPPAAPTPIPVPHQDPFVQAVRLAEQAATDGRQAQSAADWLDLATRWQRASDLMAEVIPKDERFRTAQDRIKVYGRNSKMALAQADRRRAQETSSSTTPAPSASTSPKGNPSP